MVVHVLGKHEVRDSNSLGGSISSCSKTELAKLLMLVQFQLTFLLSNCLIGKAEVLIFESCYLCVVSSMDRTTGYEPVNAGSIPTLRAI